MTIHSVFVFDVDGTLTRPRQEIETIHDHLFRKVCKLKSTYIVTGSSWEMLCEQVPETTLFGCAGVYTCLGNVLHRRGKLIFKNDHQFSPDLLHECEKFIWGSKYEKKFGEHKQERVGMLNVSTVGRGANNYERGEYVKWEAKNHERAIWASEMVDQFPEYDFSIGGSISIDITPKNKNKSQILKQFDPKTYIEFYGDKTGFGGNDYPLMRALEHRGNSYTTQINNYRETYRHIKNILEAGF